jgi:H+/Cl- antiporter ClcA
MDESFYGAASFQDAIGKLAFTLVSLVGGWKGGAFVPLMAAGALWGSALSGLTSSLTSGTGAALGIFCIINKRFDVPFTCIALTGEFFGWKMALISVPMHLAIKYFKMPKKLKPAKDL